MTRYITINNPAGWEEYEKYELGQLRDRGYDGVILPQGDMTDYFVFSNKSISAKGPKELNEVGEANAEPYEFERVDYPKEYIYKFTTEDQDNYIVNAMQMTNSWIVDYRLATIDSTFLDVVNKGRVYRVMATLHKIMQDFVQTADPQVIRFEPTKNANGDDRRYKLYTAFIKKNLPYNYSMQYKEPYGFTLTKKQSLGKNN
jgi:hypothetical protein